MDFIEQLAAGVSAPVEKQLTFNGETGSVWFKRLNGAQKLSLLKGKQYDYTAGEAMTMKIDMELSERENQQMVAFCACNQDGSKRFKNAAEVAVLDQALIAALARLAAEVNATLEGDEPGES